MRDGAVSFGIVGKLSVFLSPHCPEAVSQDGLHPHISVRHVASLSRILDSVRRHPFVYISLLVFPAAILYGRYVYSPLDDTYIFLVYAKNFLEGHGLTYNGALVEGYSSPLWLGILAILGLTRIPLPTLAEVLSTVSGLSVLLTTYVLGFQVMRSRLGAFIPVVLLASTGDFVFYMSVGMEQVLFTSLVVLCVLAGCYSDNKHPWIMLLLMTVMVLLRPEGLLFAALVLAMQSIRQRSVLRSAWQGLALCTALLPFIALRWHVCGTLLPNTYFVKSGLGLANLPQGLEYMASARTRYGPAMLVLAGLFGLSVLTARDKALRILPLLFISISWLLYVTAQGGDNFPGGRMYLPVVPLLFTALAALFAHFPRHRASVWLTGALVLSLVAGYLGDQQTLDTVAAERTLFTIRYNAAQYLRTHFPQDTLIALNPAGVIPYYSGMRTIDMLGLNDFHIAHHGRRDLSLPYAHQAGDGPYVLRRSPDIILLGNAASLLPAPFVSDQGIWSSGAFHKDYAPVQWPNIGWAYVRVASAGYRETASMPAVQRPH